MYKKKNVISSFILLILFLFGSVYALHIIPPNQATINNNVTVHNSEFGVLNLSDKDIMLYFPFDYNRTSNISITDDLTTNNRDGNITNAYFVEGKGKYLNAYQFDGNNVNYINVTSLYNSTLFNDSYSFSVWINFNDTTTDNVIGTDSSPAGGGWVLRKLSDRYRWVVSNDTGATSTVQALTTQTTGKWYNVIGTYNRTGNNLTVYVNGALLATVLAPTGTLINETYKPVFQIGAVSGTASATTFNGTIDEVMLFNRTLIFADVVAINSSNYSRFYSNGEQLFNVTLSNATNIVSIWLDNRSIADYGNISLSISTITGCDLTEFNCISPIKYPLIYNGSNYALLNQTLKYTISSLNITFYYNSGNNSFFSPYLVGNITVMDSVNRTISDCHTIFSSNIEINLSSNVFTNSTCITIYGSNNVTLNGKEFIINFSQNGTSGYGIIVNNSNGTIIKGIHILQGNSSSSGSMGILLIESYNSIVRNSSSKTYSDHAYPINVESYQKSVNVTVDGNFINATGSAGQNTALRATNAHNITFKNNRVFISPLAEAAKCVSLDFSNQIIFENNTCTTTGITQQGVSLGGTNYSLIANNTFSIQQADVFAVRGGTALGTVIINNTIINRNTSFYDFSNSQNHNLNGTIIIDTDIKNYSFGTNPLTLTYGWSKFGEIKFIKGVNGSGTNLSNDIIIRNNLISVNITNNIGLNKSANVTFRGLSTDFVSPVIHRGDTRCLICYNFTSLNNGEVIFNVSDLDKNYSLFETFSGSGSSGSSSGGGGAQWITTYNHDGNYTFNDTLTKEVRKKQRVRVNVTGKVYYLGILEIHEDSIKFSLSTGHNTQKELTLNKTDYLKISLVNDGYYDLGIRVESIKENNFRIQGGKYTAVVSFVYLHELIPAEEFSVITVPAPDKPKENNLYIFIGLAFLLVILIVVLIYNKLKRSTGNKKTFIY